MTDEELIKRLRSQVGDDVQHIYDHEVLFKFAADRIEELEAENRLLRDAVYIDDLTVTMQANDKTKALAGVGRALGFLDANMPEEAKAALRATLAELTGGKDAE